MATPVTAITRPATLQGAAEYEGKHPNTIRNLLRSGRLTTHRDELGGIVVDLDELDALRTGADPVERLADHIKRVVAQAPKFTDEQRARLSGLLRGDSK